MNTRMVMLQIGFVVLLLVAVWFIRRDRQDPEGYSVTGAIRSKEFRAGGKHLQTFSGANRGFQTPNPIPLGNSYVIEVLVDGTEEKLRGSVNELTGKLLTVGQRVRVQAKAVGFLFRQRKLITDISPL